MRNRVRAPLGDASVADGAAAAAPRSWRESVFARTPGESSPRFGLAAVGVTMFLLLSHQYPNFGTWTNVDTIALNMAPLLIASVGTSALLIGGQIDLSIGSMYGFLSVFTAAAARDHLPVPVVVAIALLGGAACGFLNGTLVRYLKISPLIVTIAMLAVYSGLALGFDEGRTIFGFDPGFLAISRFTALMGIDPPIVYSFVIFFVGGFLLTRTKIGLHIYAMGGDRRAARLAGIRTERLAVGLFTANGLLIGVIAVITVSRLGSASFNIGSGFEFDVVTAAILGGVAFTGGAGRPGGVLVGVSTIAVLNAGVLFAGFQDWVQLVSRGGLLLIALLADEISAFLRSRRLRRTDRDELDMGEDTADEGAFEAGKHEVREPGEVVLATHGLTKRYGAVVAVDGVDLSVRSGEVLALLGDNGAGKSSLIRMISGAEPADAGTIEIKGAPVTFSGTGDARKAGIETVYQDLALCPNLDLTHNLVLGDEPVKHILGFPIRDEARAREIATSRIMALGTRIRDVRVLVRDLSGGQRQAVAIARVFTGDPQLVILDEPTAALGVTQKQHVLDAVRRLAENGVAVILITHDISIVNRIADKVAVLRLGRLIYEGAPTGIPELALMRLMAGDPKAMRDYAPLRAVNE